MQDEDFSQIVELNVGGVFYTTTLGTLKKQENSLLAKMFTNHHEEALIKVSMKENGRKRGRRSKMDEKNMSDRLKNSQTAKENSFYKIKSTTT